uniref:Nucleosome-remodeling factor subunit BPTF n=1 Tax=Aegilops tauschii TaxID=37682 RepID=M8C4A6_AEGTA
MDVDEAPLASEGNEDGALDKQQDGAPPPVREANMDVDEAPFPSEGNEDGVLDKQQDGVAPAVSEANMDVDEASFPREDTEHHAATESKTEVNECGVLEKQQDVAASMMGKTKIVVDESSAPQQDHTVAAAPSEGDSRVVDQHPNTSDGGFPVKKDEEGECLVGRYISRSVSDDGRICLGKVASYDGSIGVYNVVFEDGQGEELLLHPLRELLMAEESSASGMKMSCRKRKLDLLVSPGSAMETKVPPRARQRVDPCKMPARPDALQETGCDSDISGNAASSSNSSVSTKELSAELCPPVQGPELPPSSADIAVPEESISHLFSVYNFLRSFNVQLFLSPFGLDDFVASINCTVQNTLLDAVHVSLLRALRRHLETKSSGGSELASNCLKYVDWALLDVLTWPTFLLEYLYLMGYIKSLGGKSFGRTLLAIEYYKLPVAMKLRLLQILCDHVIESGELKAELEAREGYNEETEYETDSSILSEAGSQAVLTRASKASVSKKVEGLQDLETASNVTNTEAVLLHSSQDGNSDDCRICGMDGTLVCCDGCPWAYHSRCIGLNKAFLPQGLWFCPECVVNKLGPASSRIERGARGAQMFGIDMCGRLFLGSCNYLLVIGTSTDAGSYARYYNQYDVVKVMRILAPSDAYTDICMRITEYWRHLLDIFQNERSKIGKEAGVRYTTQSNTLSSVTPMDGAVGSVLTTLKDAAGSKTVVTPQRDVQHEIVVNQFTLCSAEHLEKQKCMVTSVGAPTEKNNEVCRQTPLAPNDIHNTPMNGAFRPAGISSISHENSSVVTGVSSVMPAQSSHGLVRPDISCGFGIDNGLSGQNTGNTISVKAGLSCPSYKGKYPLQLISEIGSTSDGKSAEVPSFKPQAYMNLYNHGNVAASAAANLAILTSEEGKVSVSQLTTNPRKKMAADCALQVKAFSSPAAQFIWPSTGRKIMEVPRDRCGWCIACKISAAGAKKACFLNVATANAVKGSARILSAMHVIKSSGSHFPSITAYMVNMEESLRGLLVGSLQDLQQRQRWHKQLQEASNCKTIVPLLLELESNIRSIAFSPIWVKLVDDWPLESPPASAGALRPAAYQKRGTGGRRGRKRSLVTESAAAADDDKSWKKVNWWSGGNISKRILQRGVHLSSAIRNAARQGGKKRMAGLSYHDCSILPRRTRQFAWRACVGLSQNSSQLALQVRYLDAHIRWKEFLSPDQIPSDGKSSDADFSALRNAVLCDKKIVDNKIRYALKFPNQKHLPVRVTKNILEAEAAKVQAQPVAKVKAQPVTKVETWPVAKVEALSTAKVQTHPITELKACPVANLATQNVAGLQAQAKIEANRSKSEKPRRRKRPEEIKYFGLSWKKNKSDRSGSDFRANDVILKCKDGIGSAIKPTCCLCKKSYCPDFLYVRCEQCKGFLTSDVPLHTAWFHGDALRLEEERILEVVQYRCCKCRRRAMPICPHSDDYKKPGPEFSEQTVATSSQSSMLSSEETASVADQDPLLASYGIVEPIGEETFDADLSMNTVRFTSGINQKLTIRRAQGKNSGCVDQAGVDEYSNQNQPLADANVDFSHMNGFSLSELEGVDPSELLGWDLSQGNEYTSPPDYTANCQLNGASCGSAATGDFELQTFFSFTDLLEADDTRFGQTFGMSAGLQDDGNCTGSFDQEIASFDDMAFMVEDVSSNMHFPANAPPPDDVPCKKCNNSQPPPDLKCLVCGLRIHRQCSPWDESDLPVESADWACGACREWR